MRVDGRQRIVKGASATLTWQGVDSSGEPADPGTVTVGVVRADGTTLLAPLTATTGTGSSPRAVALSGAQTSTLDWLTASWTVAGTVVATTVHEVVGGVYMTTDQIRTAEPSLADRSSYSVAALIAARDRSERAWERECHRAFVPRFRVATVRNGVLPDSDIRTIRFVRSTLGATMSYTWAAGTRVVDDLFTSDPVVVAYEYGFDAPPSDLLEKFARTVRHSLFAPKSGIDARAMSYTSPTGEVQRFPTPGLGPWIYGIPDVDQVIIKYRVNVPGIA